MVGRQRGRPSSRARALFTVVLSVTALALVARPVAAHGVGTRFDAPVPLPALLLGAGATLLLTAALLAVRPPGESRRVLRRVGPRTVRAVRLVLRAVVVVALAFVVSEGLRGPDAPTRNLATLVVWPLWFTGLGLVSVLVGSPWRALSPWRAAHDALSALEGREVALREYPEALGAWPAAVAYVLLLGVAYNLTRLPDLPAATVGVVAVYGLYAVGGGVVFGRAWFERADPLTVFYDLLGRVAPVAVESAGDGGVRVVLRSPWRACSRPTSDVAHVWLVVASVFTVTFDGLVETPAYRALYDGLRAGGADATVSVVIYFVGIALTLVLFHLTTRAVGRIGGFDRPARSVGLSVVPVAAAYEVAHNYAFVLTYLGQLPTTVGRAAVDVLGWVPLSTFWLTQVTLVVAGHVVAVVAAHAAVRTRVRNDRRALRAHLPLVALMVGFTAMSLWVLSRPVA